MTDYTFSLEGDHFYGSYKSREDALIDALNDAKNEGLHGSITVYTGVAVQPGLNFEGMAEDILENAQMQAEEEDPDDYSWGWLDDVDRKEFASVIESWFKKQGLKIPYFLVEQVKEHQVEVRDE